jgi:hypothetical protein
MHYLYQTFSEMVLTGLTPLKSDRFSRPERVIAQKSQRTKSHNHLIAENKRQLTN